ARWPRPCWAAPASRPPRWLIRRWPRRPPSKTASKTCASRMARRPTQIRRTIPRISAPAGPTTGRTTPAAATGPTTGATSTTAKCTFLGGGPPPAPRFINSGRLRSRLAHLKGPCHERNLDDLGLRFAGAADHPADPLLQYQLFLLLP